MDNNLDHLPVVDHDQRAKLAGNNPALADELFAMLVERLTKDLEQIKSLSKTSDYGALRDEIHKLHGAVSYCGTPRLKAVLMKLETDLKNDIVADLPYLLKRLDNEVKQVLNYSTSRGTSIAK